LAAFVGRSHELWSRLLVEGHTMDDIRTLLRIAGRRIDATLLLAKLHESALVAACIALALMIADRLPAAPFVPWVWVLPILAVAAVIAAVVMWHRARKDEHAIALIVDERLDLREKLSTALHVKDRDDAFARAAVEDAVLAARDPRSREMAKRHFGIEGPRGWWGGPLVILLVVIVSFLPSLDVFSREAPPSPEVLATQHQVAETLDAVVRSIAANPELSGELSDLLGDLTKEAGTEGDRQPKSPDQMRRDAIKRMTDLNDRLNEILTGERGKQADALNKSLRELQTPQDGAAKEFAEALAAGDFSAAKKALEEMMAKLESGEIGQEQAAELAEQLQNIAEQLEKLAEQQKELEDALRRAGMDPQLANNPDALREAIENNPNLNEQQKQQLQQMAEAQQAAQSMCQGLAGACAGLAQAMQGGDQGQAGNAASQLGDQLSELEQLQQLLEQAQAAMSACQGGCQGLGQGLGLQQLAGGIGGEGRQDNQGNRGVAPTPTRTRMERVHTETVDGGDIIGRMLIDGPQVVGESKVTPREVVSEIIEGFEESINEEQIPRRYHEAQKRYFGELDRRTRQMEEPPAGD
jgi:hypothetical protein